MEELERELLKGWGKFDWEMTIIDRYRLQPLDVIIALT
jgi:hypothetical protein